MGKEKCMDCGFLGKPTEHTLFCRIGNFVSIRQKCSARMHTRRRGRWLLKQPRLGARMCQGTFFLSYRKLRFYTIKNAPRGSHCGGMVECRLRDPPQAENPVEQDSFLRKGSLVFLAKEQIPVQAADHNNAAEDIADGGRDQIVEDKGSDI